MHLQPGVLVRPQVRSPSILNNLLKLITDIFSAPKGDQGGWEGGARGL